MHRLTHVNLTTLEGGFCCPPFIAEETEAQRAWSPAHYHSSLAGDRHPGDPAPESSPHCALYQGLRLSDVRPPVLFNTEGVTFRTEAHFKIETERGSREGPCK